MERKFDMIVAADANWAIGCDDELLYHIPEDMAFFRKMTLGRIIVMGRKTKDSLPKGHLPQRVNVIMTRNLPSGHDIRASYIEAPIVEVRSIETLEKFLIDDEFWKPCPRCPAVIIIGGAEIYKLFLEKGLIRRVFLTEFSEAHPKGNKFIPNLYEAGFVYDPNHYLHETTGYEEFSVSEKNKDEKYPMKFRIRTLVYKG